ncbi:probable E3 SUMO-protein ligase RNF212 isoform X1 [Electrophorus electricus]|uniref:probable E3 SUMO-protein ligase RNF212 isoform X1 n=1 Tax=Electrophorus electricus TaxID=8005 RepID=UPI0015CF8CF2|nr:probable E3 SUMO-protein ligase RNF212 isoform X1 [Electrophorus electricus]
MIMSQWICCNSCFKSPGPDRQLAVTSCGHVICNICFQTGKKGECLICKAKCQLFPLSDKSSSDVKALFSDIGTTANRYFLEISKVLQFQARHQKRLLSYYQERNEKMNEAVIKMQQEMQQMSKKIAEKNAYISKLEVALKQSSRLGSQSNKDFHASSNLKPVPFSSPVSSVTKISYSSPVSLSHHLSTTSLIENMETERGFPPKPEISGSVSRLCVISPPQDGRIGTVQHRAANPATMGIHLVRSATVSRQSPSILREPALPLSSNVPYHRNSSWEMPAFKLLPAYKYPSMSCLGLPP